MKKAIFVSLAALVAVACGGSSNESEVAAAPPPPPAPAPVYDLPDMFDCLRENGGALVAAHRGGPTDGYPENALETLQYAFDQGIRVFEIDVAETGDGVLTLMHDDRLDRTTIGGGYISDTSWNDLSRLALVDNRGKKTEFNPPKLTDVLLWAKNSGAILELDRKTSTSFRNIISSVRAAGAENNVILISYNDNQAAEIAKLAPELMLTATARGSRDIGKLTSRGVKKENLIAWTGTERVDEAAWARNAKEGVESAFGTLGRRGDRLDDVYAADGDLSEFVKLAKNGATLIATDIPYQVKDVVRLDFRGVSSCGIQVD